MLWMFHNCLLEQLDGKLYQFEKISSHYLPSWAVNSLLEGTSRCSLHSHPILPTITEPAKTDSALGESRNGTIKSITDIVKNISEADLDPNTGMKHDSGARALLETRLIIDHLGSSTDADWILKRS